MLKEKLVAMQLENLNNKIQTYFDLLCVKYGCRQDELKDFMTIQEKEELARMLQILID